MDVRISSAQRLRGSLNLPPDKSIGQRAALLAALARGTTEIRPWPDADDCQRTLELIQALGVAVMASSGSVRIEGRELHGLRAPSRELFCGESGTTFRLAAGVLAGQPFESRLTAGTGLSRRPMKRIVEPLMQMGARVQGSGSSADVSECYPPLTIRGAVPLRAIRYAQRLPSAQVKSAILLAGLFARGGTTIIEPTPTRDHTERLLRHYGAAVRRQGSEITLESQPLVSPGTLSLPGDVSSAAFVAVAAAAIPDSRVTLHEVGLNPTRTQWLQVLARMGASIRTQVEEQAWEPWGTITVEARPLRGATIDASEAPSLIDELPILMVAAAGAQGRSVFHGLAELRVKETDRMHSMVAGLRQLGAQIRLIEPDTVEVIGGPLQGGAVEGAGDHRTAMSLAVAGLMARGATTIRGAECVSKSFPEFFEQLRGLAGSTTVKTVDNG